MGKKPELAVLSLAILPIFVCFVVSPALADIAAAFPESSQFTVQLVVTLPKVLIIPCAILYSAWCGYLRQRTIIWMALILYLIGGVGGGFANSMETLLACRALLGIGAGLLIPLSKNVILSAYQGDEQSKMMGMGCAASCLASIMLAPVAGWLASLSWRYPFGIYAIALIVGGLVMLFFNEPGAEVKGDSRLHGLPWEVYLVAFVGFGVGAASYTIHTNMAFFLKTNALGEAALVGTVISAMTAGGFVGGLCVPRLEKVFGEGLMVFLLTLMAIAFALLGTAKNLGTVFGGTALVGFCCSATWATLFLTVSKVAAQGSKVFAISLLVSMIALGRFLSPVITGFLGGFFNNPACGFGFIICSFQLIALALAWLLIMKLNESNRVEVEV